MKIFLKAEKSHFFKKLSAILLSAVLLTVLSGCSVKIFRANYSPLTEAQLSELSENLSKAQGLPKKSGDYIFKGSAVFDSAENYAAFDSDLKFNLKKQTLRGKHAVLENDGFTANSSEKTFSTKGNVVTVKSEDESLSITVSESNTVESLIKIPDVFNYFYKHLPQNIKKIPIDDIEYAKQRERLLIHITITRASAACLFFGGNIPGIATGDIYLVYESDMALRGIKATFTAEVQYSDIKDPDIIWGYYNRPAKIVSDFVLS